MLFKELRSESPKTGICVGKINYYLVRVYSLKMTTLVATCSWSM